MDSNSFTNNFFGNVQNVQIQQGTEDSYQKQENIDYAGYQEILTELKKYENESNEEFGDNVVSLREEINNLENMVKNKDKESKIKKVLKTIKEIAIEASGGVVASAIIELLKGF